MPERLARVPARWKARVAEYTPAIELVGTSAAVARVHELVRRAVPLRTPVLLVAESGIDIESVARVFASRDANQSYTSIDCATDGVELEARLFGTPSSPGSNLEQASDDSLLATSQGGTLFLKDVTDLSASLQSRLLRALRDGEVSVNERPVSLDLRIIASAPPVIEGEIQHNRFRGDLYRRLSPTRIDLPALRDRQQDIPVLVERMLIELPISAGSEQRSFTRAALGLLSVLLWPGNLAELRAAIGRILANTSDATIQVEQVLPSLQLDRGPAPFVPAGTLREARECFERDYIAAVLQHHGWRIAEAAATLGIQRTNLYRKARQLGIPVARISR